jgi:hypothetical protein
MGKITTPSLGFLQPVEVNIRNGSQMKACPLCAELLNDALGIGFDQC